MKISTLFTLGLLYTVNAIDLEQRRGGDRRRDGDDGDGQDEDRAEECAALDPADLPDDAGRRCCGPRAGEDAPEWCADLLIEQCNAMDPNDLPRWGAKRCCGEFIGDDAPEWCADIYDDLLEECYAYDPDDLPRRAERKCCGRGVETEDRPDWCPLPRICKARWDDCSEDLVATKVCEFGV